MPTQCNEEQLAPSCVERRRVAAAFDSGHVCSNGGVHLLKRTDEVIGLVDRLAVCFVDARQARRVEHSAHALLVRRMCALALAATRISTTTSGCARTRCSACRPASLMTQSPAGARSNGWR